MYESCDPSLMDRAERDWSQKSGKPHGTPFVVGFGDEIR
jgi:hypothetical protein